MPEFIKFCINGFVVAGMLTVTMVLIGVGSWLLKLDPHFQSGLSLLGVLCGCFSLCHWVFWSYNFNNGEENE